MYILTKNTKKITREVYKMHGRGAKVAISLLISTVFALSGCGNNNMQDLGVNKSESGAKASTHQVKQEAAKVEDAAKKTYKPDFTASGEKKDDYTQKMENLQKEFVQYFEKSGELDKVKGYKEPIKVHTTNWYTAAVEEAVSNFNKKYGETIDKNRWIDAMKRMYNIDVTYNWQAQDADYEQKLRLDMTSGELPDVFIVRDQNDLVQMAQQGLIWDLSDVLDTYATDYDKKVWESDEGGALTKATVDGKVYGMPSMQSATDAVSYIWIRDDWMKKLNLKYPKTMDELKEVMKAFVTQDPDGNGKKDTWGMNMYNQVVQPARGIFAAFGSYPDDWYENGKKLVYGAVDQHTKDALGYLAGLYKDGLINPEFVAQDTTKANEYILNDKIGILFDGHWFAHTAGDLHKLDPNASWKCIQMPTSDGKPVKHILRPSVQGWIVVNKKFAHPEIAVKMRSLTTLALLGSDSAWWWYEDNIAWNISPVRCNVSAMDNLDTYKNLLQVFESKDESQLRAKAVPYWDNLHGEQAWEWNLMFGPGADTPLAVLKKDEEAGNLIWNPYNGAQSSFMQSRWSNVESEKSRFFTDIITGKTDLDDGYKKWLDTYKNLGGDKINKEVNDWYAKNGKK